MSLHITDPKFNTIAIRVKNQMDADVLSQIHPHLDKKVWQTSSLLQLKSEQKPFPVNVDVGILKWRFGFLDADKLPLTCKFIQKRRIFVN